MDEKLVKRCKKKAAKLDAKVIQLKPVDEEDDEVGGGGEKIYTENTHTRNPSCMVFSRLH